MAKIEERLEEARTQGVGSQMTSYEQAYLGAPGLSAYKNNKPPLPRFSDKKQNKFFNPNEIMSAYTKPDYKGSSSKRKSNGARKNSFKAPTCTTGGSSFVQ